jgi:hypothetical protein
MAFRKVAEDASTVTVGWDEVPGQEGYVPTIDGSDVLTDGKRHPGTSKTQRQVRIGKRQDGQPHRYGAKVLTAKEEGSVVVPEPAPAQAGSLPRLGISNGSRIVDRRTSAEQDAELDKCRAVGAQTVRFDMWQQGEALARVVLDKARARGLEPMIVLGGTRRNWSTPTPRDWALWAAAQVGVVGSRCRLYEVCNEPDLNNCTPEVYTAVLRETYGRVKAANPEAVVVGGALWKWDQGSTANPQAGTVGWVDRMWDAGAADYLDVLSLHLYDDPLAAGDWNTWNKLPLIRAIVGPDLPIVSTESGGPVPKYTLEQQATFVRRALVDERIESAYIYTMLDDDVPGFGIYGRPAYDAFRAVANG